MSANPPTQELRRTPLRLRLLWGALTGLSFGAIAFASSRLVFFEGLEGITLDLRQQLLAAPTPASNQVAVILIDEYSIQQMLRKELVTWPWQRDVYVPIILYLKKAGARAIVFDLIFTDAGQPQIDAALAEAAREAGNVVFASKLEVSVPGLEPLEPEKEAARIRDEAAAVEKGRVAVDGWPHPPRPDLTRIVAPLPELTAAARGVGFTNVRQDAGGAVRRAELCYPYPDASSVIGSLPLMGALAALGAEGKTSLSADSLQVGGRRIPLGAEGRAFIRFYGKELTLQTDNAFSIIASFVALEEGKAPVVDPARFDGKVVFIGANAAGLGDIVSVPVSDRFPGTEFVATVCANILGGEFLEELATPGRALLFLASGLAGGLLAFWAWRPIPAALSTLALMLLHAGASFALFQSAAAPRAIDVFLPFGILGGTFLTATITGYFVEGRQKREVARAFGQYLSPTVIRDLMKDPGGLKLGGETRDITVYFSDIQGFSTFSQGMTSAELVAFLNIYLTAMSDVIMDRRGMVDKYEGDAIMAAWGAPQPLENHALEACLAALDQRQALVPLNERFEAEGRPRLRFRAGLNSGPATVGNMGSARRFSYTAMGDTVNLASRLEGANKFFGTSVMISEAVRAAAGGAILTRRLGRVVVVGRSVPTEVHELLGRAGDLADGALRRLARYHEALALLEKGQAAEALSSLESIRAEGPDPVVDVLLEKSREMERTRAVWDGIWILESKG